MSHRLIPRCVRMKLLNSRFHDMSCTWISDWLLHDLSWRRKPRDVRTLGRKSNWPAWPVSWYIAQNKIWLVMSTPTPREDYTGWLHSITTFYIDRAIQADCTQLVTYWASACACALAHFALRNDEYKRHVIERRSVVRSTVNDGHQSTPKKEIERPNALSRKLTTQNWSGPIDGIDYSVTWLQQSTQL